MTCSLFSATMQYYLLNSFEWLTVNNKKISQNPIKTT